MANITREPTTGSLAFTGEDAYFLNSGDNKLIFTGYRPIVNPGAILTYTGELTLTGQPAYRMTGLWFEGYPPTLGASHRALPGVGTLSLSSVKLELINSTPPAIIKLPTTVSLTLTGYESALQVERARPGKVALALTGYAPNVGTSPPVGGVDKPRYPFFGQLFLTGQPLTIDVANSGTSITNSLATTDVPVNYQIDDRTGFKIKIKKPMIEEYTGFMTRPDSLDRQSEQDFIRSKKEHQKGATHPDDTGNEIFITTPVSADDL